MKPQHVLCWDYGSIMEPGVLCLWLAGVSWGCGASAADSDGWLYGMLHGDLLVVLLVDGLQAA